MDLKLPKMLCKDSKQHHVMFHELNSVSSLLCIAQNVRFEIPYKDLYFETPFLMIFKYYAWASYGRTTNFSEEEKLLLAELGKEFPEVESKGYDNKMLTKKAKAWEEILKKFNSQNPNGIKRDMNQIQGCWRRLKVQSDKEHDLQRRESRKTGGGKAPASPS